MFMLTPQALARESWYATVLGDGRETSSEEVSASWSKFRLSSAAIASSAAADRMADESELRWTFFFLEGPSGLPQPVLTIAELAPRLGMKRSAAWVGTALVLDLDETDLAVADLDEVVLVEAALVLVPAGDLHWLYLPVPVKVKSDTPSSSALLGAAVERAMLDLGEFCCCWGCLGLALERARCAVRFPP